MGDMEEPPTKVSKFEMESSFMEGEAMDETHEEWLSEGVLTDDDQHATEPDTSANMSQDVTGDSMESMDHSLSQDLLQMNPEATQIILEGSITKDHDFSQDQNMSQDQISQDQIMSQDHEISQDQSISQDESISQESEQVQQESQEVGIQLELTESRNIEETLNSLENSHENQMEDLPGDLKTFLVRKPERRRQEMAKEETKESDLDESVPQEEDDGNDTDDLLRLLGDSDEKNKRRAVTAVTTACAADDKEGSSDDDDYVLTGARVTTLQVAKNALLRRPASLAQPEDDDATDASTDEETRPPRDSKPQTHKRPATKHTVHVLHRPPQRIAHTPPVRQYANKRTESNNRREVTHNNSVLKKRPEKRDSIRETKEEPRKEVKKDTKVETKREIKAVPKEVKREEKKETRDIKMEDITVKREVLQKAQDNQRLMRPEQMDDEELSDMDSDEDDDYDDEMPSSESENMDEWFTLDIRAERAGEYIPLLGDKAHQLLAEEKERVSRKLETLRKSLTALTDTSKKQADELRQASAAVAELDTMLKAT